MDRDHRICIVGAGAAGLTAAHELTKLGYRRVTVLEKEQRVGGKCQTILHEGRTYELGAGFYTGAYRTVQSIMHEMHVMGTRAGSFLHVDFARARCQKTWLYLPAARWLRAIPGLVTLFGQLLRHRRLFRPGWNELAAELAQPFDVWAQNKGLETAADALLPGYTNFGYGRYEEVATAYVLKYLTIVRPIRELRATGYGGLWQRVAARLDVRRGCPVLSIRRGTTVQIDTPQERLECDTLILACPLDETLSVLDASAEERALFSAIRYYDYHGFAAFTEGLPAAEGGLVQDVRPGRVAFWYRRWLDRNLCMFYSLGHSSYGMQQPLDHEEIRRNVEADLAQFGIRITGYLSDRVGKLFPHVTPAEFAAGYYERLEALQGQKNTYYVGELLSFPTVEMVAAYSRHIIHAHFR